MEPVFRHPVAVTDAMTDQNRHVNNIAYLQWMQDAAIAHSERCGATRLAQNLGATWVVRAHRIEYLSPAFAGDDVIVVTWVVNFRKVRSLRRYKVVRPRDRAVLAQGETDWVFLNATTGRPRAIPDEIANAFGVVAGEPEV